jgi:hypothetical protein
LGPAPALIGDGAGGSALASVNKPAWRVIFDHMFCIA